MAITAVTDRTAANVARLKELRAKIVSTGFQSLTFAEQGEWNAEMKGAYNFSDLNRVGNSINEIASRLNSYGYGITVNPKIDFNQFDYISEEQITKYILDLNTIKNKFYATTALPTTINGLNVDNANNIEKMLLEVEGNIDRMLLVFRYVGELICGEAQ